MVGKKTLCWWIFTIIDVSAYISLLCSPKEKKKKGSVRLTVGYTGTESLTVLTGSTPEALCSTFI
jgi:hypothetical protein